MSAPSRTSALSFAHRVEVWWQFTVRAVEMRHRGSHLGLAWAVLNPLLMLGLYVVVFSFVFKNGFNVLPNETRVDYALGVFAGLVVFHVFAETLAASPTFILNNPNLVKKVVFPLELLPLSNVAALWFHAAISFSLLFLGALMTGRITSVVGVAWLVPILLPHVLLCVGLSLFMSAFGVFFRDVGQITGFLSQVVLYASAVFFSVQSVQSIPALWAVMRWNPILHTIDATRCVLLWHLPVNTWGLAYSWACGLVSLGIGSWFFHRTKSGFADVL